MRRGNCEIGQKEKNGSEQNQEFKFSERNKKKKGTEKHKTDLDQNP